MKPDETSKQSGDRLARAPRGTPLTYGIVGLVLGSLTLFAVAGFYGISLWREGVLILGVAALSFTAGILVHLRRSARQKAMEGRRDSPPPKPPEHL
jgi:hypothetical protein